MTENSILTVCHSAFQTRLKVEVLTVCVCVCVCMCECALRACMRVLARVYWLPQTCQCTQLVCTASTQLTSTCKHVHLLYSVNMYISSTLNVGTSDSCNVYIYHTRVHVYVHLFNVAIETKISKPNNSTSIDQRTT